MLDKGRKPLYTDAKLKKLKPESQGSKQGPPLSESRRWWEGGRRSRAEWTDEGGPKGNE